MSEIKTAKDVATAIQSMPFGEVMNLVSAFQNAKIGRKQFDGATLMRACDIILGNIKPESPTPKAKKEKTPPG